MVHFPFDLLAFSLKGVCKKITIFALTQFLSSILCSCSWRELCGSSLFTVARSFDSSISTTTLSNLGVKERKIFATAYCYVTVSPRVFTWFTNRVILVVKSLMISFSSIRINSSWRLWVYNLTTFAFSSPAYAFSKISHTCFDDLQSPTFSKLSPSTHWCIKNNTLKHFFFSSLCVNRYAFVAPWTKGFTSFLITSRTSR